jgi:hypothetical protein
MKKSIIVFFVLIIGLLIASAPTQMVIANPTVTIEVLNLPTGDLELDEGESYTFNIEITSDDPFILAIAMTDAYYPGRGVFWHGSDRASKTSSATLHLTIKGKESTASLPDGVAPIAIVAGVRFKGGVVYSERFDFNVRVK